ncbi:MAG: response regulator [Butyrivibrio sp.]|nr:response regulator [Butyrivibrio sp.]
MDKRVLLIGLQKSFMVNAIVVGLQKAEYEVVPVAPFQSAIEAIENRPQIYVLYLGDLTMEHAPLFEYLNSAIDADKFMLYLIGNNDELMGVQSVISKSKITQTYLRPLDIKLLVDHLDMVVDYSAVDENLRKKILIIDDDGAMLRMMKTWLSVKYHVYMASSGKIALSFLAQTPVDLVLLDYEMPVMSGPEVLKTIRDTQAIKNTPVIFLTAKDDKESVMKVISLKPIKYLLKSMPKDKLIGAIDDYFVAVDARNKTNEEN